MCLGNGQRCDVTPETFSLLGGRLEVAVASDTGQRVENQDHWLVDEPLGLLVVADGMGGRYQGADASFLVCKSLLKTIGEGGSLEQGAWHATRDIEQYRRAHDLPATMGSTMVSLHWTGEQFDLVWVGDSIALGIHEGICRSLTLDHSMMANQLARGEITIADIPKHTQRTILTQALGPTSTLSLAPGINVGGLKTGERVLLASDGLFECYNPQMLASIVSRSRDASEAVEELMYGAKIRWVYDNVTVLVGEWRGEDTAEEKRLKRLGFWNWPEESFE